MFVPSPGARLGNYEIVRAIGAGSMGIVYEARHEALDKVVAIKVLHRFAPDTKRWAVAMARFLREGRLAAHVRHPHVVDVFDFGVHEGAPFLVMELVEGESLAERLEREGPLSLETALALLLPVVSAVAELHSAGIIHRDLKPANILLGRGRGGDLHPKVADFGVSRMSEDAETLTEPGGVVGTYKYMPPEQARSARAATEAADQYAVAAMLYECVTGHAPFGDGSAYELAHAVNRSSLTPASSHGTKLPEELDAVLLRALSFDPNARFACIEEMGGALCHFAAPDVAARWADELDDRDASVETAHAIPPVAASTRFLAPSANRASIVVISLSAIAFAVVLIGSVALRGRSATPAAAVGSGRPSMSTEHVVELSRASGQSRETTVPPATVPLASVNPPVAVLPQAKGRARASAPPRAEPAGHHDIGEVGDNGAPLLDPR